MIFLNNQNILRILYGKRRKRIWKTGDVVKNIVDLPRIIKLNVENPNRYKEMQEIVLNEIYEFKDGKSAERIISAIKGLLKGEAKLHKSKF